jgi:hypothetical protein
MYVAGGWYPRRCSRISLSGNRIGRGLRDDLQRVYPKFAMFLPPPRYRVPPGLLSGIKFCRRMPLTPILQVRLYILSEVRPLSRDDDLDDIAHAETRIC